jgi:hypothetical protein
MLEIRGLVLRNENQGQRIKDFRAERLGRILAGETPHPIAEAPVLVAHLVPTQAALEIAQINPAIYAQQRYLPLFGHTSNLARMNVDGALSLSQATPSGEIPGYSQFFRSGFFEATYVAPTFGGPQRVLQSTTIERSLITLLTEFRAELVHFGIDAEVAVMVSLLHADKLVLSTPPVPPTERNGREATFDRKVVLLPDVLTQGDSAADQALRPMFDLLWQSAGYTRSFSYDESGVRIAR